MKRLSSKVASNNFQVSKFNSQFQSKLEESIQDFSLFFQSGHKEAGTAYLFNERLNREHQEPTDSGTGTPTTFRLLKESVCPADFPSRPGAGRPGAEDRQPRRDSGGHSGRPRQGASLRGQRLAGTRRGRASRCEGRWRPGSRLGAPAAAPPPRTPADLLIRIPAARPPLTSAPRRPPDLPPRPLQSTARRDNPQAALHTLDKDSRNSRIPHLRIWSPRPLPTASLLRRRRRRRRRRQQLHLETARDRARAPGTLAQRAAYPSPSPARPAHCQDERLARLAQSRARAEREPVHWSVLRLRGLGRAPPRAPGNGGCVWLAAAGAKPAGGAQGQRGFLEAASGAGERVPASDPCPRVLSSPEENAAPLEATLVWSGVTRSTLV